MSAGQTMRGTFRIPADHPALAGHFPGNPIVPAVVLLEETLAILGQTHPGRMQAIRVKFTTPVRAETEIAVTATVPEDDAPLAFAATCDGRAVLAGSLRIETLSEQAG